MQSTKTKACRCKSCLNTIDAHTFIGKEQVQPSVGDISICYYCEKISTFDDDMNLKSMSNDELRLLMLNDHETWSTLQRASKLIIERVSKN